MRVYQTNEIKNIALLGSVGKTTTKQMTYAAIAGFGNTIKTEGNQNKDAQASYDQAS